MREPGFRDDGPNVLQIDQGSEAKKCKGHSELRPGLAVGLDAWERYLMRLVDYGFDFHGIFAKAPADEIAGVIARNWPDATWWLDVACRSLYWPYYRYGGTNLPDMALILKLRSWPWTIVTGAENYEAQGRFDKRIAAMAEVIHDVLGTDVVAVSNTCTLELVQGQPEAPQLYHEHWKDEGGEGQWLAERGIFVPPFFVDDVDGFIRMRLAGLPREEVVRVDIFRNLNVEQPK